MIGEERGVVGRQKRYPDKEGGCDAEKDIPGFVEVIGKFASEEGQHATDQNEETVVGEWDEESLLGLVAVKFDVSFSQDGHRKRCLDRPHYQGH